MKKNNLSGKYIWQRSDWPAFRWDSERLLGPMSRLNLLQGRLSGQMSMLGFGKKDEAFLSAMTDDLTASSEIEGVALNPGSVRSSIARKLGIDVEGTLVEDRYIEGLVEVMIDATRNSEAPLTEDRLWGWHASLFPTGRSGMYKITVGDWRKGDEPMQVVSGALGHERVHYEAPPSDRVATEMRSFLEWCNNATFHPFIMSAVAHLWFVTIHPFDDGNGRIGRTIADMFLSRLDSGNGRYYSVSAEIKRNKKAYYEKLENAQHGDMDVTPWLLWYMECIESAINRASGMVESTLQKAMYWDRFSGVSLNERQRKVLNRLWDGFEGRLTTSKWAKMCHCSQDTALRDIYDLILKNMLVAGKEGGRSTHYLLPEVTD